MILPQTILRFIVISLICINVSCSEPEQKDHRIEFVEMMYGQQLQAENDKIFLILRNDGCKGCFQTVLKWTEIFSKCKKMVVIKSHRIDLTTFSKAEEIELVTYNSPDFMRMDFGFEGSGVLFWHKGAMESVPIKYEEIESIEKRLTTACK